MDTGHTPGTPTVAALYVDSRGVYANLPGVEVWDEARDARLYAGPWPVVAHPPCKWYSLMGNCRPELREGNDGGCFEAALAAVRAFGGVLEHPRHTRAWKRCGLHRPAAMGWCRSLHDEGWTCEVDQYWYGHRCNKPTWLYYVGEAEPPRLRWGKGRSGVYVSDDGGGGRDQRSKTPPAFRDVLLQMARSAAAVSGEVER